ncbi:Ltp family lipoprotein [Psychrobacillus sp. NPDC096426]|uniref:Ltp family lipoprotein n=1 Tax=Psychrobacillus sp. NPDC096426 TaxID=3364491 RepID=UPI00382981E1
MSEKMKVKKPFYKRWWFIVIAVIVVIGVIGSLGKDETETDKVETSAPVVEETAEEKAATEQKAKEEAEAEAKAEEERIAQEKAEAEVKAKEASVPREHKSALKKAESYAKTMHMSKAGIYEQLTSEYGENFPPEAAQYAIENIVFDWNENALKKGAIICRNYEYVRFGYL